MATNRRTTTTNAAIAPAPMDYAAKLKELRAAEKAIRDQAKAAGVNLAASAKLPDTPEGGAFRGAEIVEGDNGERWVACYFRVGNGQKLSKDGRRYLFACSAMKGGEVVEVKGEAGRWTFGGGFMLEAAK